MLHHDPTGTIIVGLADGQVELLQTHTCVRKRLADAKAEANDIQASLEEAKNGLRQQMSREQELHRSIEDLEIKCAHISIFIFQGSVFTCVYL